MIVTPEEIRRHELLLGAYRHTLRYYLQQQVQDDTVAQPIGIGHGIMDARVAIRQTKDALLSAGYTILDYPDDQANL